MTRRRAIADDAIALVRDAGDPAALACVLRDTWHAVWSADTVPQIAEMTDELLRVAGSGSDPALQWWAAHRDYIVSVVLGRFERAADALTRLEKIAYGLGQPALRWHATGARASWEQLHGDLAASEEQRERALVLGQVPHDSLRTTALALYADAAAQTASVAAAEALYELLEPWANQVIYTGALGYGHARMYLGQLDHALGRDELAVKHLEFACRFHEEHDLLLWAAQSHLWLARAPLRRDRAASCGSARPLPNDPGRSRRGSARVSPRSRR